MSYCCGSFLFIISHGYFRIDEKGRYIFPICETLEYYMKYCPFCGVELK